MREPSRSRLLEDSDHVMQPRYERGLIDSSAAARTMREADNVGTCLPQTGAERQKLRPIRERHERSVVAVVAHQDCQLSVRSKYLGTDEAWEAAESSLEKAAKANSLNYKRVEGEAAFYGPKLDFMFKDAIGREWQLATIQCDFNLPMRFELEYTDSDGSKKQPVVIHRAISG